MLWFQFGCCDKELAEHNLRKKLFICLTILLQITLLQGRQSKNLKYHHQNQGQRGNKCADPCLPTCSQPAFSTPVLSWTTEWGHHSGLPFPTNQQSRLSPKACPQPNLTRSLSFPFQVSQLWWFEREVRLFSMSSCIEHLVPGWWYCWRMRFSLLGK